MAEAIADGDGMLVFFNDPIPCDDPAWQAVRLAVATRDRTAELSRQWRRRGRDLEPDVEGRIRPRDTWMARSAYQTPVAPTEIRLLRERHVAVGQDVGMQSSCRTVLAVIALVLVPLAGCGSSSSGRPAVTSGDPGSVTTESESTVVPITTDSPTTDSPTTDAAEPGADRLAAGPVTYIALGDSLTAGDGDDTYQGYVGVIGAAIGAVPGREDISIANLGASGWDSTMMVDGQDGAPGQLGQAVEQAREAVTAGRAVLATVLIGSNDLWYLYEYGPPEGTPPASEDAAEETFRANLDRTVQELTEAGAVVVIGLPDDQSLRPSVADIDRLHDFLPDITVDEVRQMAVMAGRLDRAAEDIAAAHGVLTVDTNAPFWADPARMADDGIHPNTAGYADLAALWLATISGLT